MIANETLKYIEAEATSTMQWGRFSCREVNGHFVKATEVMVGKVEWTVDGCKVVEEEIEKFVFQ